MAPIAQRLAFSASAAVRTAIRLSHRHPVAAFQSQCRMNSSGSGGDDGNAVKKPYVHNLAAEWINPYPVADSTHSAQGSAPTSDEELSVSSIPIPRPHRPNEPSDVRRARLQWMARKRGILETDLLLGTFAVWPRLAAMSDVQLAELDALLEENDWDIYYWATGARVPPPRISQMSIFPELFEHSKNKAKQILRMPELIHAPDLNPSSAPPSSAPTSENKS